MASDEPTDRVMVDLETLGVERGVAILSIGAVRFGPDGLGDTFSRSVDLQSCQDAGLDIDAESLDWWLRQDDDLQDVLTGGDDLDKVLFDFGTYYGNADEIWAHSPAFDCEILEAAYAAVGRTEPWHFEDERDSRTLTALPVDVDVEREGDEHDALDDAIYQARTASKILQCLEEIDR